MPAHPFILTRLRHGLLAALAALSVSIAAPAAAQPSESNDQIARAHFMAATGYFDTGDYESALREFERAYALTQYAQLLYNLYACHERLGQLEPAIARLEQFLAASPEAPNHAALEERLVNLRRRHAAQQAGGTGTPNGEDPPPTLMTHPETDEPAETQPAETDVGEPEAEASTDASGGGNGAAIAMFGVAGAGVVTFAVAGLMTRSEDRALARTCGRDGARDCTDAEVRGLRRRSITADVGLSLGVVSGIVGLVLLLVQGDDEPADRDVAVQADVRPGGASVTVGGRF